MNIRALLVTFCGILGSICAYGSLMGTSTLPEGINSPSLRFGMIDGISQKYTESGSLMNLGDYKSVVFDAKSLAKFNSDAKRLIDALNRFGGHNLGDAFNLGVLRVDTMPKVQYYAPVFARGITKNWTIGVGVPVVSYTNKISLSQEFSNIEYYRQQFSGLNPELDAALNTDLSKATNETLTAKGYKPLANRDESFIGDVNVVSIYKFYEKGDITMAHQAQLNLPTGPKYDTDDLAALNVFGRTNITNSFVYSHKIFAGAYLVPYVSYLVNIPDNITARVPTNEDDTLPDATTKEDVTRTLGNIATVGGNAFYEFSDSWTLGAGYDYSTKEKDVYRGDRNTRYDLLALNSASTAHRVKAELTYSTVNSYFKKTALIPMMISYQISDVFAGVNIERQLAQEMNLMMFF